METEEQSPNDGRQEPALSRPDGVRRRRRWLAIFCWGYIFLLVIVIVFLRTLGDRLILPTVILFAPRWPWTIPLAILIPAALRRHKAIAFEFPTPSPGTPGEGWDEGLPQNHVKDPHPNPLPEYREREPEPPSRKSNCPVRRQKRLLPLLAIAIFLAVVPLMEFNIGWPPVTRPPPLARPLRMVAFNVQRVDLTDARVERFMADVHPDVVAMEELPVNFNPRLFPAPAWHLARHGELGIASRYPIIAVDAIIDDVAMQCALATPGGRVDVVIVHLSSPHFALRDTVKGTQQGQADLSLNIRQRRQEADLLGKIAAGMRGPLIIAGDFNLTPDSWLFRGQFTTMTDCFESTGFGFGWTYRNQWTAVRIDHVLSNADFESRAFSVGPDLGSHHRPIIADLVLKPGIDNQAISR